MWRNGCLLAGLVVGFWLIGNPVTASDGQSNSASDRASVIVFDASGSMWNRMDGDISRIEVARDVMEEYFANRDPAVPLSVIAYGHRQRGNCDDIEVIAELGLHDAAELTARLRGLNPQGMTPLTASLALARGQIPPTAEAADIILVTDGLENCGGDPCALAAEIAAEGIDIRAHVVGFALTGEEVGTLACVPEATGGMLFQASSGAELAEALAAVTEPEPAPQPAALSFRAIDARDGRPLAAVDWTLIEAASEQAIIEAAGRSVLEAVLEDGDYRIHAEAPGFKGTLDLTAEAGMTGTRDVPLDKILATLTLTGVDAETDALVAYVDWTLIDLATETATEETATGTETTLLLPPSDYRVEGHAGELSGAAQVTLGLETDTVLTVELEAPLPEVAIAGPASVTAGAPLTLEWSETIHPRDYVGIVPMGAPEGETGIWTRTGRSTSTNLTAPGEPGMYELRYTLQAGNRTLASAPLEVVDAATSISGPATATAGETITLEWSQTIHPRDYVGIVPMGAAEGETGIWTRVGRNTSANLTAPGESGMYELRYTLQAGNRTLASAPLEVVDAATSISGPATATAGETITLEWSATIHPRDYVGIVPMGAPEGETGIWTRVGNNTSANLTAPGEPGMYELRYTLQAGNRTLASAPMEVVAASVSISGPDEVRQGDRLEITWSNTIHPRDRIVIVPMGADPGELGTWRRTGQSGTMHAFDAPEATGLYEARYILEAGRAVLDSHVFEVLDARAALEAGVSISAPDRAAPGETVTVTWTGGSDGSDRRITLARADQAIFTWVEAQRIEDETEATFTLPAQPGFFEFRYLDVSAQEVLSRTPIEIR